MSVRELLNDLQYKGKICVYQDEFCDCLGFDANDDEEILSDAEVVKYEFGYGSLYIKIK